MAAIRQILHRKQAAQSICRITKTMEMISTARFKLYNRLWQSVSDYHNALASAGYLMTTGEAALTHPLLGERTGPKRAVLTVGSTRGLCGSYNSEVFKLLAVHLKMAQGAVTRDVEALPVKVGQRKGGSPHPAVAALPVAAWYN